LQSAGLLAHCYFVPLGLADAAPELRFSDTEVITPSTCRSVKKSPPVTLVEAVRKIGTACYSTPGDWSVSAGRGDDGYDGGDDDCLEAHYTMQARLITTRPISQLDIFSDHGLEFTPRNKDGVTLLDLTSAFVSVYGLPCSAEL